jgi:hypothetical protein
MITSMIYNIHDMDDIHGSIHVMDDIHHNIHVMADIHDNIHVMDGMSLDMRVENRRGYGRTWT